MNVSYEQIVGKNSNFNTNWNNLWSDIANLVIELWITNVFFLKIGKIKKWTTNYYQEQQQLNEVYLTSLICSLLSIEKRW
jgi:hypothetical protein